MKPIIAITGNRYIHPQKLPGPPLQGIWLSDDYARGVEEAGGIPLIVPFLADEESLADIALRADGLLLSGGDDIDPNYFGEQPRLGLGQITPERDALEIALLQAMHRLGKPVFGICRGMQLMNVAFGGSLYQDLPREWEGAIQHSQRAPRGHLTHTVHVELGSRLYEWLGNERDVRVNTFHHQAVKQLADGFVPVAWDDEGLVEAMEMPNQPFVVAVQWHPENLWQTHVRFRGLFKGFVQAAQASLAVR